MRVIPGFSEEFDALPVVTSFKENPARLANVVPAGQIFTNTSNVDLPNVPFVMPSLDRFSEHPVAIIAAATVALGIIKTRATSKMPRHGKKKGFAESHGSGIKYGCVRLILERTR